MSGGFNAAERSEEKEEGHTTEEEEEEENTTLPLPLSRTRAEEGRVEHDS